MGLETSGEVRRVYNNTEQIFLTFLFEDFLTMNFLFEVGLERVQQMYLPDFFKPWVDILAISSGFPKSPHVPKMIRGKDAANTFLHMQLQLFLDNGKVC